VTTLHLAGYTVTLEGLPMSSASTTQMNSRQGGCGLTMPFGWKSPVLSLMAEGCFGTTNLSSGTAESPFTSVSSSGSHRMTHQLKHSSSATKPTVTTELIG